MSLLGALLNKAPVPLAPRYAGGTAASILGAPTGQQAELSAMSATGTVFAIIDLIASEVAASQWKLWRKAANGDPDNRTEVTSHAAIDLWEHPTRFHTRSDLMEASQQHQELTGEGWVLIGRDGRSSLPLELWGARPDRMTPVPDPDEYLAGYIYTGPSGERVPLELDDVLFLRRPNPVDAYRGLSPVASVLTRIGSVKAAAEWNRNFFANSAEPGGLIEVPDSLGDDDFNRLSKRWAESHRGVNRAHRVAILEGGAKWVANAATMRDMQFVELDRVSAEQIREAWRVGKTMLGLTEDVNRATAQAAMAVFGRQLVIPRLERWKQMLNHRLLPMYGSTARGLEWDYENPVPEDEEAEAAERTSKVTAAVALIGTGKFVPAAVLEAMDLPEIEETEEPEPAPVIVAPPIQPGGGEEPGVVPSPGAPADPPAAGAPGAGAPANLALPDDVSRETFWNVWDAKNPPLPADDHPDLTPMQDAWQAALDRLIERWGPLLSDWQDDLVAQVKRAIGDGDLVALAALGITAGAQTSAADLVADVMVELGADAADQVVKEAKAQDVTLDPVAPAHHEVSQVAKTIVAILAAEMALGTGAEALRVHGPGATPASVADALAGYFADLTDARPRQLLGGALTGAQNAGRIGTFANAPEGAIYASEQLDGNTCGPCRKINGRWLGNVSDMAMITKTYPGGAYGGYVDCEGRSRCRGTVFGVLRPRTTTGEQ